MKNTYVHVLLGVALAFVLSTSASARDFSQPGADAGNNIPSVQIKHPPSPGPDRGDRPGKPDRHDFRPPHYQPPKWPRPGHRPPPPHPGYRPAPPPPGPSLYLFPPLWQPTPPPPPYPPSLIPAPGAGDVYIYVPIRP
ncbi:MAG TPA: hypothetical protein H9768_02025 [Candidatus Mailhella merdavium]|nr:hypothetical protein [Candidatus Mailhella merdavium]